MRRKKTNKNSNLVRPHPPPRPTRYLRHAPRAHEDTRRAPRQLAPTGVRAHLAVTWEAERGTTRVRVARWPRTLFYRGYKYRPPPPPPRLTPTPPPPLLLSRFLEEGSSRHAHRPLARSWEEARRRHTPPPRPKKGGKKKKLEKKKYQTHRIAPHRITRGGGGGERGGKP